jgi:DNA-directed RNA polymerase subunit RPC12/RpoP
MKLSRFTIIGMAAVGILLLVWAGLMLFSSSGSTKSGPAVTDINHCPVCGRMLPQAYIGTGECPYCKAAEAKGEKIVKKAQPLTIPTVIPVALLGAFFILLTTHLVLIYRSRVAQRRPEAVYYIHCSKCGRKLRYRDTQVGKVAACPLCRKPIIFPKPPQQQAVPWWKRGWPKAAHG